MDKFILNNRFVVDPSRNLVNDKDTEIEIHLEPRLMKLLCLFCSNTGNLLSRDYIYKEIWNNYGGADEGLTQAISFLRKALSDKDKKIIETIPKKGYILHAISVKEEKLKPGKTWTIYHFSRFFLAAGCIVMVFMYVSQQLRTTKNENPDSEEIEKRRNGKIDRRTVSFEKIRMIESEKTDGKRKKETAIVRGLKLSKEKLASLEKQNSANGIEKRKSETTHLVTVSSGKKKNGGEQGKGKEKY